MSETLIVYAKRTPIGKLSGALAAASAPQLAAPLVKDALNTTGVRPDSVDEIIIGCVLPAGVGQAPARQVALHGGLPKSVCATTINRVCGSGLKAVMLADQAIRSGDASVIFAGGMESMSQAPHLLPGSRGGFKFGSVELKDHMQLDGLWDPYKNIHMGNCAETCAAKYGFTREQQDQFAMASVQRAQAATKSGAFAGEIAPVTVKGRTGDTVISIDEGPGKVKLEKIPTLKAAFKKDGTITAASSSSINDGAAALVLMRASSAAKLGLKPLARIVSHAVHAQEPNWFATAPVGAVKKALAKAGWNVKDVDLWEVNEAFAVVPMALMHEIGLRHEIVNVNGGACALGHPIGASGARIMVTLLYALQARGLKKGVATLCIGGGEGTAVAIEMI